MPFNYLVSVGSAATGPWTPFNTVSVLTDTITGLTPSTTYFFQVIPVDVASQQQGPPTVAGPVTTMAIVTGPAQNGTNFTVTAPTTTGVTVNMTAPVGVVGAITYTAQYKRFCDFNWTPFALGSSASAQVAFPITGLSTNTLYHFRMNANGSRFSPWVAQATATGGQTTSPDGFIVSHPLIESSAYRITSQSNHTWSLQEATQPFQIVVDSILDTSTKEVLFLIYSGGRVYYQNKDYNWFMKTLPTDTWTATSDPRVGVPTG